VGKAPARKDSSFSWIEKTTPAEPFPEPPLALTLLAARRVFGRCHR
jgi:hypothetical protein